MAYIPRPESLDPSTNTIEDFFMSAVRQDFTRDFFFRIVSIHLDGPSTDENLNLVKSDLVYAKTGKLPARIIGNAEVKYAGQLFNMPAAASFPGSDGYEIEFYCSEDSTLREILMNESTRTFGNIYGLAGSGSVFNGLGTIANERSVIILHQLNKKLQPIYEYRLIGCSIRNVGDLAYTTAEGTGQVLSFTASFAYHFFERDIKGGEVLDSITPIDR